MAATRCEKCGLIYDDTYRWTYCPHNTFAMACCTTRINRETGKLEAIIATSVEQQQAFIEQHDVKLN